MAEGIGGSDVSAFVTRWRDLGVELRTAADGMLWARVTAARSLSFLQLAQDDEDYPMRRLVDLTAIDRGVGSPSRFEVVYWLDSPVAHESLRVIVPVPDAAEGEAPTVESVTGLWPAANWLEREVFDLLGIRFRGHPDLRRLLLEQDFEGAPLRKDYPLQPDLPLPKEVAS